MKKYYRAPLFLISLSYLLLSCSNKEISCASDTSKNLVKQILAENSDVDQYVFSKAGISQLELLDFYTEYSELNHIRTSSIQEEIKKCECQGTLKFILPPDLLYKLENERTREFEIIYSVQETEEGDMFGEAYFPEGLDYTAASYLQIIKEDQKYFAEKELEDLTEYSGNSDIYVQALKEFLIADWHKKKHSKAYKGSPIGRIFMEENQLNIYDTYGSFLSVYDFNSLYITQTKNLNIVISITNSGGGEGGNVGIEEQYLISQNGSDAYKIILAYEQVI